MSAHGSDPPQFDVLASGLLFPEAPRWHDGMLWVSEKRAGRVLGMQADGVVVASIEIEGEPGGIGWLPDDTMLVVSMARRRVVRIRGDEAPHDHGDVSALTTYRCNDMVVDWRGFAYVGDFGYDMAAGAEPTPGVLVVVPPTGTAPRVVATGLEFPNGMVVCADGSTLVVAESAAQRLTAFDIADDGSLTARRVWASLGRIVPDGICLDATGAIWVADPLGNEVVRVAEGGVVLERIAVPQGAFACELGGDDGHTLFVCTYDAAASRSPTPTPVGQIIAMRVTEPAAA